MSKKTRNHYSRREAQRRYPKYCLKDSIGSGPGKEWKKLWAREVRRTWKIELLRDPDGGNTPLNRIGSNRDWC